MPLKRLDEHVDATKVGAYCASKNGSFARHRNSRRGSGAGDLPSLELGRHAPIVKAACRATLAEHI